LPKKEEWEGWPAPKRPYPGFEPEESCLREVKGSWAPRLLKKFQFSYSLKASLVPKSGRYIFVKIETKRAFEKIKRQ
jgi:hypothetical protein